MRTVQINLVNNSNKRVSYRNGSGSGTLGPGEDRTIIATTGTKVYFENNSGPSKILEVKESHHGETIFYS